MNIYISTWISIHGPLSKKNLFKNHKMYFAFRKPWPSHSNNGITSLRGEHFTRYIICDVMGKGVVWRHISRNLIFTLPPSLRANKIMSQLVYIPPIGLQHGLRLP